MTIGFAVLKKDNAVTTYADLLSSRYIIEPTDSWREFYAWVVSYNEKPLDTVVVCDMWCVGYLDYIRYKLSPTIIGLEINLPVEWDFNRKYTSYDLGWGVDKIHWKQVGENRIWSRRPVFYFTEPAEKLEKEVMALGYKAVHGNRTYAMGNVAVVPGKRHVPHDIYEAMASGMAVVTTVDNARWLDGMPSFGVTIEDGIESVVGEVVRSDYNFLGMMAQEVVPDLRTFRDNLKRLLTLS